MAQNVTIQGASYSDVPSVTLPKTGGGTAYFTDVTATTATESDVSSGKIFYKADGSQAVGSHVDSGGTITEDGNGDIELGKTGNIALITPLSVTENDTYTAPANTGYSPVNVNVSGGGVATQSVSSSYSHIANIYYIDANGVLQTYLTGDPMSPTFSATCPVGSMITVLSRNANSCPMTNATCVSTPSPGGGTYKWIGIFQVNS